MERRRLSYDEWDDSIWDKKLRVKYINDTFFNGYIGEIDILKVPKPQIWKFNGEDIIVCQEGYKWLSILPGNDFYCITAMMDEENRILLWYIDMIAGQGVDNDGVPYFDDLYLDLVVYPDGTVLEDDRNELEEALEIKDITLEQFELANNTCEKLKKGILSDVSVFKEYTLKCKEFLLG